MKLFRATAASSIPTAAAGAAANTAEWEEKVVYHVNDATNAAVALTNIRNHLNASPKASIVLVAHGPGGDFLIEEARDKNGNPDDAVVRELAGAKVQFRVCNNTLETRKIDRTSILPEASVVPSGVAELTHVQCREGYAYLKP